MSLCVGVMGVSVGYIYFFDCARLFGMCVCVCVWMWQRERKGQGSWAVFQFLS